MSGFRKLKTNAAAHLLVARGAATIPLFAFAAPHRSTTFRQGSPSDLVGFRFDPDGNSSCTQLASAEILRERSPRGFVFDEDTPGAILLRLGNHGAAKLRVQEALTKDVEQVEVLSGKEPCRADGIVVEFPCLGGGIPALYHVPTGGSGLVCLEPLPLDDLTLRRDRLLLILCGEIVRAD